MQSYKLVPPFILNELQVGRKNGRFSAACLFIDTSGFTPLTSQLMKHGKAGAETLADVLATLFKPLLQIVYAHHGFISGFAGDGLKAVFPLGELDPALVASQAAQSAWEMQQFMAQNKVVETPFGSFSFAAKVSVAYGEVEWGIWEGEASQDRNHQHRAYYIEGKAMAACLSADAFAVAGDLLFTPTIVNLLPQGSYTAVFKEGFYFVSDLSFVKLAVPEAAVQNQPNSELDFIDSLDSFFPAARLPQTIGEFRRVVTLFINLQTMPNPSQFAPIFFQLLNQYGGYLCRIGRIGDQDLGVTLHIFWGAPEAHENDIARALNFALDLRQSSSVNMRMGISSNMAFAGYIGGNERAEYTCYSSYVNLAARQMVLAKWDEILVDSETVAYADDPFVFEERTPHIFKGFNEPRAVAALNDRQGQEREPFFRGDLIGRETETAVLHQALTPLMKQQYAGVIAIIGEAGIGKSRLVHEFLEQSPILDGCDLFLLQTDEVLRQSLNPFRYLLRHLFDQSASQSEADNSKRFRTIYQNMVTSTKDQQLQETLEKKRPFIASLLNIQEEHDLIASLDPTLGFENTIIGLKSLLIRLAQDNSIILQLEDAHWLDEDSKVFIKQLFRNVQHLPIALVTTSREPLPNALFDANVNEPQTVLNLRPLPANQMRAFCEERLAAKVSSTLVDALATRTDGNPFFMEQLLLYWQENNFLTHNSKQQLAVTEAGQEIPYDVQTILMARIDQLVQEVRDVVQTAAILGREFELIILSHILKEDISLSNKIAQAEQAAIWSAISEMQYLFKHALMRDTAYEMQLEARLSQLHLLAAQAFEQVFANDVAVWAVDLAYHYDRANEREKAIDWYRQAGDKAAAGYANTEAVSYYTRAIALLADTQLEEKYELLLKREYLNVLRGDREAQKSDLDEIGSLITQLDDGSEAAQQRRTEFSLRQAVYLDLISNAVESAEMAKTAVSLAQQTSDYARLARGYIAWGKALWPQSLLEEAEEKLEQALQIAQDHNFRDLEGQSLRFLGVVLDFRGLFKESRVKSRAAQLIFQELKQLDGVGSTYNNIGISYLKQGRHQEARSALNKALKNHQESGNRAGVGWNSGNLGFVASQLGEFDQAITYYEQANEIFIELGDQWSQAMAQGHLGNTADKQGHLSKALRYHTKALAGFEALGYRQGVGNAKAALGAFWSQLGRLELSLTLLTEALDIFTEIKAQRNQDQGLMTRALIYHLRGEHETAVVDAQKAVEGARSREDRHVLAYALTHLADAQTALGLLDRAVAHYQEAAQLRQESGENHLRMDTLAGLANAYQMQGKLGEATPLVEEILAYLDAESVAGVNQGNTVYWVCYQHLKQLEAERAESLLAEAYAYLETTAATIEEPEYQKLFWQDVPVNAQIKAAYK